MSRALKGSRCKTRRKQVTGIPPTPVTIGSHTLATPIDVPTSKTLAEDMIHAEFVARQLAIIEEEPTEEPSPSNELGESYVADVQQSGKHILLSCTNTEEHQHLINHFNEQLNTKIFNMFKDPFTT